MVRGHHGAGALRALAHQHPVRRLVGQVEEDDEEEEEEEEEKEKEEEKQKELGVQMWSKDVEYEEEGKAHLTTQGSEEAGILRSPGRLPAFPVFLFLLRGLPASATAASGTETPSLSPFPSLERKDMALGLPWVRKG